MKNSASGNSKIRKFFAMQGDLTKNPPGLIFENEHEVKEVGRIRFSAIDPRIRGFSHFPKSAKPLFRYSKKKGRRPQNLEPWAGYWLITDRAKAVFEAVDPFAFDFMACEITYDDGSPAVPAWFCDVVRFVDAMDEELSDVQVFHDGRKRYHLVGSRRLVFKPDEVGPAHIFRIAHAPSKVVCDDVLRKACKDAKLKSLAFIDAIR